MRAAHDEGVLFCGERRRDGASAALHTLIPTNLVGMDDSDNTVQSTRNPHKPRGGGYRADRADMAMHLSASPKEPRTLIRASWR